MVAIFNLQLNRGLQILSVVSRPLAASGKLQNKYCWPDTNWRSVLGKIVPGICSNGFHSLPREFLMPFTPGNINVWFFFCSCSSEVSFCNPQHSTKVNRKDFQPVWTEVLEGGPPFCPCYPQVPIKSYRLIIMACLKHRDWALKIFLCW